MVSEPLTIKITFRCNVYRCEPHFYIEKLGFAGVYIFSLFLIKNRDCGYLIEAPRLDKAVLTCTHNQCFEQNYLKKIKFFQ